MYLRFLQLKRSGNVKLRNKMRKGKAGWFVVSMCFFGAGLVFMGNPSSVHADETGGSNPQTESVSTEPQTNLENKIGYQQPVINNALDNGGQQVKSQNLNSQVILQSNAQNNNVSDSSTKQVPAEKSKLRQGNVPVTQDGEVSKNAIEPNVDSYDDVNNLAKSDPDDKNAQWYLTKGGILHVGTGTLSSSPRGASDPDNSPFALGRKSNLVKSISIDGKVTVGKNANGFFAGFGNLTDINGMENLDTSMTEDMSYMFYDDENLTNVDFKDFNTQNVTSMNEMFNITTSLTSLDLSHFNTSKVTNMMEMFEGATSLTSLNLDGWDTSKVINMRYMFGDMWKITDLDVSKLNTDSAEDVSCMFNGDKALKTVNISNFNTSNVKEYGGMFFSCSSLISVDISNIDMSKSAFNSMFDSYEGSEDFKSSSPEHIKVGEKTDLLNAGGLTINPDNIVDVYTGKWVNDNDSTDILTSDQLRNRYSPSSTDPKKIRASYSWQRKIITDDVTLKTNLGDKVIKGVKGPSDTDIEIDAPAVDGYTVTPAKVKAHVGIGAEGKIAVNSQDEYDVTYTPTPKKPSGGSSHHSDSDKNTNSVEQLNQTVMTYHNQGNIKLYTMDGQEITNRELYPGSDWFSDEVVTRNNVKYYRVATNELVKAEDALVYVDHADTIVTKDGAPKSLSNEHSQNVSDRKLMSNTAWKTDRYVFFNGTKFYRVATNEWVNAEDVQDNL